MKRAWKVLKITGLVTVVIAGLFYFVAIRPSVKFLEENKTAAIQIANSFAKCVQTDLVVANCQKQYMVTDASGESLRVLAEKMAAKLGPRLEASPEEQTFSANTFRGTSGTKQTLSFAVKARYQNERDVTEKYILVKESNKPLLIQSFQLNSNLLFKE